MLCPLALHYVPVPLFTYLHNALWSHQSRGCWWDAWRHHARIEFLFVYFRLLRQMNRRFDHRLPPRRPKQCYGLCNWHLSKASPFNDRTILITKGQFFFHFLSIGHVRSINILTWRRGFQVKLLYFVLSSLYLSLFWELRDKINLKICNFDPKASEPCLLNTSNVAY